MAMLRQAQMFSYVCSGLKEYHKMLIDKKYKNNRPGLEKTFYNSWQVEVIDPFGNRLSFNEKITLNELNE